MENIRLNRNYTIDITGMTHEGQGVGRVNNFTVFVDGALERETVEVKVTQLKKSYAVGDLVKVLKPSAGRTVPFCPVFESCGGCSLQHLDYGEQLRFKTKLVEDSIRRIGKLEDVVIHDTIGMDNAKNYRNKAQYPVGMCGSGPVSGFYTRRSHEIIESDVCGIQDEVSGQIRALVMEFMRKHRISAYDEKKGTGLVRHIMTRVGFKTGEVMVVIVINGKELPHRQELVDTLVAAFPKVKSVYVNLNQKNTNIILGDKSIRVYGSETITDYIGEFKFNISPLSFFQVNPVQTDVLYGKALEYAGLTGSETVFDLYCGIGTISLFLSKKAGKVYGVEVVEAAIKDARENAALNGVTNVEFMVGEAERVIPEIYEKGIRADVVVVDPPRKGCDEVLLKTLVDMQPRRIVYVSCKPSTLARDLKYLADNGYRTVEVQPVDMFPWTAHVECVASTIREG